MHFTHEIEINEQLQLLRDNGFADLVEAMLLPGVWTRTSRRLNKSQLALVMRLTPTDLNRRLEDAQQFLRGLA